MASSAASGDAPDISTDNDDEAVVNILTYGDPIRSFAEAISPLTDETVLRIDEDGLHTTHIDPANVGMVDMTAHAEGFERFEISEPIAVGLDISRFQNAVSFARKRGGDGDPVTIDIFADPVRIRVGATRPDRGMKRYSEWFHIDPDSIRKEPDVPNLTLPCRADPQPRALKDGVHGISDKYVRVTRDEQTFMLASKDDLGDVDDDDEDWVADTVLYPNSAWDERDDGEEAASSLFSIDYLEDFADALVASKADRVTVCWAEEHPTKLRFEHDEWGFEGVYMLAPRIQKEQ
jgi:proliferating cell nuclear antigen